MRNIILILLLCIFMFTGGCAIFDAFKKPVDESTVPSDPKEALWRIVTKSSSGWITMFAIPIIALGTVACFNGAVKLGLSTIIFGSVNLFMSLATARFALWMAVFGLIGSFAAVVASILVKNKGLREIVYGIQEVKDIAKEDNIDLVFQDKMSEALQKQAKSTKKIVAKVKTKLKIQQARLSAKLNK